MTAANSVEGATPRPAESLRELAERATPGPWRTASNRPFGPYVDADTSPLAADGRHVLIRNWKEVCLNAAYIAAANPAAILALLDELASTRAALREAQRHEQQVVMRAIEATIIAVDEQMRARIPREAQTIDYAGILKASRAALDSAAGEGT